MSIKKEILLSILSFAFVLQMQSQNAIKTLDNKVFKSNIGSICEETTGPSPCAGQQIYLILKFNKKKVEITELHVSSCDEESINYKLEYEWELINNTEIKIHYEPEEVKYKSIENIAFKMIDDVLFGYKENWNNKVVEYKFMQQINLDKSKIKADFVSSKTQSHNSNEPIVVIPEIVKEDNCKFLSLNVYPFNDEPGGTNIRQEPNGKIILTLNHKEDYFMLTITEARNEWFKVTKVEGIEYNIIDIPGKSGWIHSSVIEASTRRRVKLLDAPKTGTVVGSIDMEIGVRIKDKCSGWIKIEYNGLSGWIESKWLCGNPVTTCP